MRTLRHLLAALTLLLPPLYGQAENRTITDAYGQQVSVPAKPQRIVALSELDLDVLLALGESPIGAVNGRGQSGLPRYLAERAPAITVVGDLGSVNMERLLELEPDLILTGTDRPETLQLYQTIAPTVVTFKPGGPWPETLHRIADILGKPEAAQAFTKRYEARVANAKATLAKYQGQSLSIVRWNPKGPVYMLEDAFSSIVVRHLGLVRPVIQRKPGFTHSQALSLESLELLDGDWMVVGTLAGAGEAVDAMRQAQTTPAFQQLRAVQSGRMAAVDGSLWTSVGGPLAALQVIDDIEAILTRSSAAESFAAPGPQ